MAEDHGVPLDLELQHLGRHLGLDEELGVGKHVPQRLLEVSIDVCGGLHGHRFRVAGGKFAGLASLADPARVR